MELLLSNEMTIKEVNERFQNRFPYLKLQFYKPGCIPKQPCPRLCRIGETTRLGHIIGNFLPALLAFVPGETVSQLEQQFKRKLGLVVKVYRRANGLWQEAAYPEHLALEKQNALGARVFRASFNAHTLYL